VTVCLTVGGGGNGCAGSGSVHGHAKPWERSGDASLLAARYVIVDDNKFAAALTAAASAIEQQRLVDGGGGAAQSGDSPSAPTATLTTGAEEEGDGGLAPGAAVPVAGLCQWQRRYAQLRQEELGTFAYDPVTKVVGKRCTPAFRCCPTAAQRTPAVPLSSVDRDPETIRVVVHGTSSSLCARACVVTCLNYAVVPTVTSCACDRVAAV
jgi:hypothetical protein